MTFNIALFAVSGLYSATTAALNSAGVTTAAAREAQKKAVEKQSRKRILAKTSKRMQRRVSVGAARSVSTSFPKAVPVVGIAAITAGLALEMKDACDSVRDMIGLEAALNAEGDPDAAKSKAESEFLCSDLIPESDDLPSRAELVAFIQTKSTNAFDQASGLASDAGDWSVSAYNSTAEVVQNLAGDVSKAAEAGILAAEGGAQTLAEKMKSATGYLSDTVEAVWEGGGFQDELEDE